MRHSQPAPEADPNIGIAALKNAKLGEEYLAFAKDAFKVSSERQVALDATTKELSDMQIGLGRESIANARADRKRYNTTFKPIEDEFVAEATSYGSAERHQAAAAEASADVQGAAASQRASAERNMAAMGIDPRSGRYAGVERAGETSTALADAGARNAARTQQRDKGLALKADVVNIGRGVPAMAAQSAATGLGANSSAYGMLQGANQNQMATNQIVQGGYGAAQAGYGNQANILQGLHNSNVNVWQAQEQMAANESAGIGSAIGGIFGFLSDENAKNDKMPIEDGKALEAVRGMRVEDWKYKPGMGDGGKDRHIGTYAQDFKEQTGVGDGKTIPAQDAVGITMKAVQDLAKVVDQLSEQIGMGNPQMGAAA